MISLLSAAQAPDVIDVVSGVALGLGLAAAVGFRVFVPFLLAALAARWGHLQPAEGFAWLASDPALIMFAAAALLEAAAYFIPFLDHLLDAAAAPLAWAAGAVLMAATMVDMAPWLRWPLAVIAGGGAAGLLHGASAGLRLGSTATTAGAGNPVYASVETGLSALIAGLALVVPVAAVILAVYLAFKTGALLRAFGRRLRRT